MEYINNDQFKMIINDQEIVASYVDLGNAIIDILKYDKTHDIKDETLLGISSPLVTDDIEDAVDRQIDDCFGEYIINQQGVIEVGDEEIYEINKTQLLNRICDIVSSRQISDIGIDAIINCIKNEYI
jgi:hypothetical protein